MRQPASSVARVAMLRQRIDDPDQRRIGQAGQHAGMIAAHDACADDADAKRAFRVGFHARCGPFGTHIVNPRIDRLDGANSPAPWFS